MKKLKVIIPIAVLVGLIPYLLILYVIKVPSCSSVFFVYSQLIFNNKDWKGVTVKLKDKQIGVSHPQDGLKLEGYGYSIVLQGYKKAERSGEKNDFSMAYKLSDGKAILLSNYGEKDIYSEQGVKECRYVDAYKENYKSWKAIEAATGRPLETDYDWRYAILSLTPADFTVFDNTKNTGVAMMLITKSFHQYTGLYKFDNNEIMGFEKTMPKAAVIELFSKNDLNRIYGISFIGNFTTEEVDAAISTITFDPK